MTVIIQKLKQAYVRVMVPIDYGSDTMLQKGCDKDVSH